MNGLSISHKLNTFNTIISLGVDGVVSNFLGENISLTLERLMETILNHFWEIWSNEN